MGLVALVWVGPYPVSMVGLDDAVVNNSYPTRETLVFLGFLQAGVVLAAEPLLARWMRRPRAWTGVVLLNTRIMTLYLWHLTAMVVGHRGLPAAGRVRARGRAADPGVVG